MTPASDYSTPIQRLVHTSTKSSRNGQDEPTYAPGDVLWGAIDVSSSSKGTAWGVQQVSTTATIRFRGYPALNPLDRLLDARWNETYVITGLRRGKLEIIADVERFIGLENIHDV